MLSARTAIATVAVTRWDAVGRHRSCLLWAQGGILILRLFSVLAAQGPAGVDGGAVFAGGGRRGRAYPPGGADGITARAQTERRTGVCVSTAAQALAGARYPPSYRYLSTAPIYISTARLPIMHWGKTTVTASQPPAAPPAPTTPARFLHAGEASCF